MEQLKVLLENDNTANKPKKIQFKDGRFTTKFLKWNRRQITEGRTNFYADEDYLISKKGNPVKKIYDKRSLRAGRKVEVKRSADRFRDGSVIIDKPTYIIKKSYIPENYEPTQNYEGDDFFLDDEWLYREIIKKNNLQEGRYRVIVVYDSDDFEEMNQYIDDENNDQLNNEALKNWGRNKSDDKENTDNILVDADIDITTNMTLTQYQQKDYNYTLYLNSTYRNVIAYLLSVGVNCRFYLTKAVEITQNVVNQVFRDNTSNDCLILPMYKFVKGKIETAKNKNTEKRYKSLLVKFEGKTLKSGVRKVGLLEEFKDGVPDDKIEYLGDELGFEIIIDKPFTNNYIHYTPLKKPLTKFKYIFTRENHAEHLTTKNNIDDVEMNDYKELKDTMKYLKDNDIYFTFTKSDRRINSISTLNERYVVRSDFGSTYLEWEKEQGLDKVFLDAKKDYMEQDFINHGTHYNGTIDFIEQDKFFPEDRHIDMSKAYTQFQKCSYYNGFMGKVSELKKVDNYKEKGFYLITNIDFSLCRNDFIYYNDNMGWYANDNIYTDAELRLLKNMGASFEVKMGCIGSKLDFHFNDEMINGREKIGEIKCKGKKIDIEIPYYTYWTGMISRQNTYNSVCMYGTQTYFQQLGIENSNIYYDEFDGCATIQYQKENIFNKRHITAQITAYQRISVMEQLLEMDTDKIIRVCVDGIYYKKHKFNKINSFRDKNGKDDMTLNNGACDCYLSNMIETKEDQYIPPPDINFDRKYYQKELWLGQGGCGKTYENLKLYSHCRCLYVAPPWKLATSVKNIYDCDVSVLSRVISQPYCDDLYKYYNVIIADECSQYTQGNKEKLFEISEKYGIKLIMLGDVGYQLEPVLEEHPVITNDEDRKEWIQVRKDVKTQMNIKVKDIPNEIFLKAWKKSGGKTYWDEEMDKTGFDNIITLTEDRRARCPILKEVKLKLREYITRGKKTNCFVYKQKIRQEAIDYIKTKIQTITEEQLKSQYKKTDLILCATHKLKDKYTELFKDIEKYYITNNTKLYNNGEIVYNIPPKGVRYRLQHSYTIHSIQGETIEPPNNLYININNLFSDRSLYTAVSRARYLNQIYLLE